MTFFFAVVAPPNAPYFENWGRAPVFILYSSVPENSNKYLDDTSAITGPDSILFASQGFV